MDKRSITEKEYYLENRNIFIAEYDGGSDGYVIVVPPLFEELARTRKALVNVSRMFAGQGMNAIRFDYYGTGFSYGAFREFSVAGALADLEAVVRHYERMGARKFSFVGCRFGGYLILEYLHRRFPYDRVLLWEPILDLTTYWDELANIAIGNQLVIYGIVRHSKEDIVRELEEKRKCVIDGYEIGYDLFRELTDQAHRRSIVEENEGGRIKSLLWRNSALYQELSRDDQDAAFLSNTRLAWDSIRFIDNHPDELLTRSAEYILDYEKAPLQIQE